VRRFTVIALLAIAAGLAVTTIGHSQGARSKGRTIVVTGTLIDTKCYSMDARNRPNDHVIPQGEMKSCATICANLGIPVGVLTAKGEVWTLVTPSKDLAGHMARIARVTGVAVYGARQLRPDRIEVQDASGRWSEVKITMPMPM
jgi:hypothetical protein